MGVKGRTRKRDKWRKRIMEREVEKKVLESKGRIEREKEKKRERDKGEKGKRSREKRTGE